MKDDETIADFEKNFRHIANESTALGEVILESKLVRKMLISLPEKFSSKLDAISESNDLETLQLDDLIGKLRTHEMTLAMRNRDKSKSKSVAFKIGVEDISTSTGEQLSFHEQLALLMEIMGKMYKKFNKAKYNDYSAANPQKNCRNSQEKNESGGGGQRFKKGESSEGRTRFKIQCHECQGFGHIVGKCANTLEKQKKSFISTWSDEETSEGQSETSDSGSEIEFPAYNALAARVSVPTGSTSTAGKMVESLKINHILSDEVKQLTVEREVFDKVIEKYKTEIAQLKSELSKSERKLAQANRAIEKFNKGKGNLDEILDQVSPKRNLFGIGHTPSITEKGASSGSKNKVTRNKIICHYCNKPGHIRPRCFIRQDDIRRFISSIPRKHPKKKVDNVNHSQQRVWVKKGELKALMCKVSSKREADWYFDSDCSKHMTGEEGNLKNIVDKNHETVTYGDGNSNAIIGEGSLPVSSK
ncbi:uncharacterized protein [Rutidosis leptorrhynchoides]|uniref:uncharacterized protein n=1 Tax=Rutidosis leptorrhynchoides TaxID=125765 RepID=UPI003A9A664D